jgi:hypothetical protein
VTWLNLECPVLKRIAWARPLTIEHGGLGAGRWNRRNSRFCPMSRSDPITHICSYFKVPADRLTEGGKELRDMAIYLLKRHTSVMNRQIGDLFEGLTYSGVSKANQRFSVRISEDRSLRKAVEKISGSMSNVKV